MIQEMIWYLAVIFCEGLPWSLGSRRLKFRDLPPESLADVSTVVLKLPRSCPSINTKISTLHHQESLHSSNAHGPEGDYIRRNRKSILDTMLQHSPDNTNSQASETEEYKTNDPQLLPIPTLDEL